MGKINRLRVLIRDYGVGTAFRMAKQKMLSSPKAQRQKAVALIKASLKESKLSIERDTNFEYEPTFGILVPLYNTDTDMLKCVVESVIKQTYSKWELCLCDGSDKEHTAVEEICKAYSKEDKRIIYKKLDCNLGISDNTNECAKMSQAEYLGLLDHDDILHPSALFEVVKELNEAKADFIYTDEVTFSGEITNIISTNFKPDFSKDTLRANNYICHFTVFTRELFNEVGGFLSKYDGSQDHDLFLRMTSKAKVVKHIARILYFWRAHEGSVVEDISAKKYAIDAGINAVQDFLQAEGINARVKSSEVYPTIYKIDYPIPENARISIIIPNRNHETDLRKCVTSIKQSSYTNYEIIIVENNSDEETIFAYYKELQKDDNVKIVTHNIPFNYSELNNAGVKEATGEYLLFLNNDTSVINKDWLSELLMFASRSDVGAVGARLFYGNDTLQHCFLITGAGENRVAIHAGLGLAKDDYGYLDRIGFNQNVNAVTGACLMVAKDKFEKVEGFDEKLPVAYNDVDLCLKLRHEGYVNIYTPYATLYHYESISRGKDTTSRLKENAEYMHNKWGDFLKDPYYNENFSLDRQYVLR